MKSEIKLARTAFQIISAIVLIAALVSIFFEGSARSADEPSSNISERENRLKQREAELDKKLKEMERLRAEVSGELEKQRKEHQEHLLKMISVYETMTPKAAASVFETLDDSLAVDAMKQMDIKKVSKIMNLLTKERAAKLSEKMTGYYVPSLDNRIGAGQVQTNHENKSAERAPAAENKQEKEVKKNDQQSTRSRSGAT